MSWILVIINSRNLIKFSKEGLKVTLM